MSQQLIHSVGRVIRFAKREAWELLRNLNVQIQDVFHEEQIVSYQNIGQLVLQSFFNKKLRLIKICFFMALKNNNKVSTLRRQHLLQQLSLFTQRFLLRNLRQTYQHFKNPSKSQILQMLSTLIDVFKSSRNRYFHSVFKILTSFKNYISPCNLKMLSFVFKTISLNTLKSAFSALNHPKVLSSSCKKIMRVLNRPVLKVLFQSWQLLVSRKYRIQDILLLEQKLKKMIKLVKQRVFTKLNSPILSASSAVLLQKIFTGLVLASLRRTYKKIGDCNVKKKQGEERLKWLIVLLKQKIKGRLQSAFSQLQNKIQLKKQLDSEQSLLQSLNMSKMQLQSRRENQNQQLSTFLIKLLAKSIRKIRIFKIQQSFNYINEYAQKVKLLASFVRTTHNLILKRNLSTKNILFQIHKKLINVQSSTSILQKIMDKFAVKLALTKVKNKSILQTKLQLSCNVLKNCLKYKIFDIIKHQAVKRVKRQASMCLVHILNRLLKLRFRWAFSQISSTLNAKRDHMKVALLLLKNIIQQKKNKNLIKGLNCLRIQLNAFSRSYRDQSAILRSLLKPTHTFSRIQVDSQPLSKLTVPLNFIAPRINCLLSSQLFLQHIQQQMSLQIKAQPVQQILNKSNIKLQQDRDELFNSEPSQKLIDFNQSAIQLVRTPFQSVSNTFRTATQQNQCTPFQLKDSLYTRSKENLNKQYVAHKKFGRNIVAYPVPVAVPVIVPMQRTIVLQEVVRQRAIRRGPLSINYIEHSMRLA